MSLNEVLLNVSNSSVLKNFSLLVIRCCLLVYVVRTQKGTSTRVFCLLDRTISHSQPVRTVSGLSTSQILKSRIVFKSQCPLICGRIFDAYGAHVFYLRGHGFHLVSSYETTLYVIVFSYEYSRRILREGRNPYLNCLNDEQLFDASSSRTKLVILIIVI